jgi:hypothetical protein
LVDFGIGWWVEWRMCYPILIFAPCVNQIVCAASVASPLVIQLTGGKEPKEGVADITVLLKSSTRPQLSAQTQL